MLVPYMDKIDGILYDVVEDEKIPITDNTVDENYLIEWTKDD